MTSSEYEKYVTQIVRQFDFCKHAKISNNRKFKGKRQPGEYEIDIAVEVRFSNIQKLTTFELPEFGKIPKRLIGKLLKSVAGDDQEAFQHLIKHRKMPLSLGRVFSDLLHFDLR